MKRLTLIIHGGVQGIFFRAFVKEHAIGVGFTGTVENLPNGTVEVIAEGKEEVLREFLHVIQGKHPFARVERIEEKWGRETGIFSNFTILHR